MKMSSNAVRHQTACSTAFWRLYAALTFNKLSAVCSACPGGFTLGYVVSKLLGIPERQARTNSIEVGMQNSVLGAVLATLHFGDPLTAVPCAISACFHSLIGSSFAAYWRSRSPDAGWCRDGV